MFVSIAIALNHALYIAEKMQNKYKKNPDYLDEIAKDVFIEFIGPFYSNTWTEQELDRQLDVFFANFAEQETVRIRTVNLPDDDDDSQTISSDDDGTLSDDDLGVVQTHHDNTQTGPQETGRNDQLSLQSQAEEILRPTPESIPGFFEEMVARRRAELKKEKETAADVAAHLKMQQQIDALSADLVRYQNSLLTDSTFNCDKNEIKQEPQGDLYSNRPICVQKYAAAQRIINCLQKNGNSPADALKIELSNKLPNGETTANILSKQRDAWGTRILLTILSICNLYIFYRGGFFTKTRGQKLADRITQEVKTSSVYDSRPRSARSA